MSLAYLPPASWKISGIAKYYREICQRPQSTSEYDMWWKSRSTRLYPSLSFIFSSCECVYIYRGPSFISNANERFCWIICRYFEYSHRIYTLNLSTMEYDSIRWCRIIIEICAYLSKWSKFHSIGDVDMCLSLGKCECCVPLMCNIDGCSIF